MTRRFAAAFVMLVSLAAQASGPRETDPENRSAASVRRLIAAYEASGAARASNSDVQKLVYKGRPAYLLMSPCCDHYNYLYDARGKKLCAPSGGIAGKGDGRCPEVLGTARPR